MDSRRPNPPAPRGATRDLTRGPIAPTLLRFALPILAGNVLQSLNGSVNAFWVGGHLGEAALTATANANNILFLLIGAVFGIGMAATILVALDVVLNPVLIFGAGPVPALGIAGSGLATGISNAAALAALLAWLRWRRHPLWIGRGDWRLFAPRWDIVRALLAKGLPTGAQMVLISVSMLVMLGLVNAHGVATASAYGAALQLWTYVQMPAMAIGAACSSMAAQNVGAGLWPRVEAIARHGVLFNFLLTGTLIGAVLALQREVLGLFLPAGSEAIAIARHLNAISLWSFLFFGVSFVLTGVVRATGAVLAPLAILAVAMWGIRVPLAWGLQGALGVDAIWWSFPASAIAAMLMTLAYYRFGRWRRARILPPEEEQALATPAEVGGLPPAPVCATAGDVAIEEEAAPVPA